MATMAAEKVIEKKQIITSLKIKNLDISYRLIKGNEARTFLLLNGFNSGLVSFEAAAETLREYGTVVLVELPGSGFSSARAKGREYSLQEQILLLKQVIEKLELKNLILLGHSMGGAIAATFAQTYPLLLQNLILESPAIFPLLLTSFLRSKLGKIFFLTLLEPWVNRRSKKVQQKYLEKAQTSFELAKPFLQILQQRAWGKIFYYILAVEPRWDLFKIKVPTLIISGAKDRVVFPRLSRGTLRKLPNSEFVRLPACGHTPHEEKTLLFTNTIMNFLQKQP
jgi:pimeloyl-ACP methyl ester carboxylesterase